MPSIPDSTDLSRLQEVQGTTGGEQLAPDDLFALRSLFLLLGTWDRNSKPATPVDTQTKSEQGERHTCSVGARRERAA
jgi:hypothetical protein